MSSPILPLQWSPDWALGVPVLDAQHQFLVQQLNDLSQNVDEGRSASELLVVVQQLEEHTYAHQRLEETMMRRAGLPNVDEHAHEHRDVQYLFRRQRHAVKAGRADEIRITRHALLLHFRNHLVQGDVDIANAVRARREAELLMTA